MGLVFCQHIQNNCLSTCITKHDSLKLEALMYQHLKVLHPQTGNLQLQVPNQLIIYLSSTQDLLFSFIQEENLIRRLDVNVTIVFVVGDGIEKSKRKTVVTLIDCLCNFLETDPMMFK
ncbi:CLUMA_CG011628, isoform A [Clunio marinus]|uniref:CLUMA_CG011628, isoform A n=1 Tax=Clunio marinus TaxID=568069 RepID=A0A1J1IES5_9DIPT|nr:CLUMA_CG011628, isoform A [Clunio marinus]